MTHIAIVGTAGIPANYGGFETLAENLVQHLSGKYAITVYCSSKSYWEKPASYKGARLRYIKLKPNGLQSVFYDAICILRAIRKSDIILLLGVSGAFLIPFIKPFYKGKFVTNVDGIEWKREKWNGLARFFLKMSENMAVRYSHAIIADNIGIREHIEQRYGRSDLNVIAYGGDHVLVNIKKTNPDQKYYFTVCRIEPENNVHVLLDAFSKINEKFVIVGNWTKSKYGRSLLNQYSAYPNIEMHTSIYDLGRLDTLRANAYCYLHGHSAGGTNPSLVEAMSLSLPVICYDVNFNRYTTYNQALYFTDAEDLVRLVTSDSSEKLDEIKIKMSAIAKEYYRWSLICADYDALFESLIK